jgi:hypothetical protein
MRMASKIPGQQPAQPRARRAKPDPAALQRELRRLEEVVSPPKPPHPPRDRQAAPATEAHTDFHASLNGDP